MTAKEQLVLNNINKLTSNQKNQILLQFINQLYFDFKLEETDDEEILAALEDMEENVFQPAKVYF